VKISIQTTYSVISCIQRQRQLWEAGLLCALFQAGKQVKPEPCLYFLAGI
jgi:hypothetical protein